MRITARILLFSKFTSGDLIETGLGLVSVPNNDIGHPVGQPGGLYIDLGGPTASAPRLDVE